MKRATPCVAAALLAAGGMSLAAAQTDKDVNRVDKSANPKAASAMSEANVPNTRPDVVSSAASAAGKKPSPPPAVRFAPQPIATASTTQGAEGRMVASIVKALNADAALKHSKISVQPVEGKVVMSGVTLTQAQKKEAIRVAASQAGETKIVDAMQSDDV